MRMHYNLKWRSGVIVAHNELETAHVKLCRAPIPLLLQVFSRYWVYDSFAYPRDVAYVWPTDSIYETVAVWMHQCRRNYHCRVFGTDLTLLINQVLQPISENLQSVTSHAPI